MNCLYANGHLCQTLEFVKLPAGDVRRLLGCVMSGKVPMMGCMFCICISLVLGMNGVVSDLHVYGFLERTMCSVVGRSYRTSSLDSSSSLPLEIYPCPSPFSPWRWREGKGGKGGGFPRQEAPLFPRSTQAFH